ncbi:alpha-hydroxy-acid oxidizing protein [Acetonema longum]|uniref:L-lactate oxidase n=1 Tax=Acetonema longum DSM 6540 TaxID=1009370 RepID=F7NHV8_9FIRM|nr:alpha-hydroxy-acid oxidizing protein [Acetonema longum]EGO64371.1 FMN-dependent family dehydrogenase [Acetonema longum DSM 6540]
MDWQTLKSNARRKFSGACRLCPVCDGVACAGEVPGMGGIGTGTSFRNNVNALASYRFNLRTVHQQNQPNLACKILGMDLSMPVIAAAIAGTALNMNNALKEEEYAKAVVGGCKQAGVIAMTGDGPKPQIWETGLEAVKNAGGCGIPIIKPREVDQVVEMAKQAAEAGATAFGIDIDAAALVNMSNAGQPVGPKSQEELAYIKQNTTIPFIVKGIMTPDDAQACQSAGVDAIVVSNHGGRALDYTPGTAEVLPYIVEAVNGKMAILVDGGVRTGGDVLKMLALGAHGVLIGRPMAVAAVGGEGEGVSLYLEKIRAELTAAMILTGSGDLSAISGEILW